LEIENSFFLPYLIYPVMINFSILWNTNILSYGFYATLCQTMSKYIKCLSIVISTSWW